MYALSFIWDTLFITRKGLIERRQVFNNNNYKRDGVAFFFCMNVVCYTSHITPSITRSGNRQFLGPLLWGRKTGNKTGVPFIVLKLRAVPLVVMTQPLLVAYTQKNKCFSHIVLHTPFPRLLASRNTDHHQTLSAFAPLSRVLEFVAAMLDGCKLYISRDLAWNVGS